MFRASIYTMANGSHKIGVTEAEKAGLFCPLSAMSKKLVFVRTFQTFKKNASKYEGKGPTQQNCNRRIFRCVRNIISTNQVRLDPSPIYL